MNVGQKETVALVGVVTSALIAIAPDASSRSAAALRHACGALDVASLLITNELGAPLFECFDLARKAGATSPGMARVRSIATASATITSTAAAARTGAIRFALIQEAKILAATTFRSRDEVDRVQATMNQAFEAAEEAAADAGADAAFRSLTTLHAAVTRDLQKRGRPLPRMTTISLAESLPAVVLANRFYADAGRADEIADENGIVHPLFAGRAVRALSA